MSATFEGASGFHAHLARFHELVKDGEGSIVLDWLVAIAHIRTQELLGVRTDKAESLGNVNRFPSGWSAIDIFGGNHGLALQPENLPVQTGGYEHFLNAGVRWNRAGQTLPGSVL